MGTIAKAKVTHYYNCYNGYFVGGLPLGRKNYLFCGDHEAAASMSVVCSLLATCKAHEVNPRDYLNDVIARMPYMQKATNDELLQLLPHKWKKE